MLFDDAYFVAIELLEDFGLVEKGWVVLPTRAKSCIACCVHHGKASTFHTQRLSESEVKDTVLHEIAHALVGANHGHDDTWKAMATRIGATPEATRDCSHYSITHRRA